MIDSHTHIFDTQFDDDRSQAIQRAVEAGVQQFILPATLAGEFDSMFLVARKYSCCAATIGLHPIAMNDNPNWKTDLAIVENYLKYPPMPIVAVGEIGLDMHWDKNFIKEQTEALILQIELAITFNLPIIFHIRDAWDLIFPILEPYKGKIKGVFHSFSGTAPQIEQIEVFGGFMYGINGTVTYKKSTLAEAVRIIGIDKILLETDSPYLPPEGHRGQRNQSCFLPIIAAKVAQIKGLTIEQVDKITTNNTITLFNL